MQPHLVLVTMNNFYFFDTWKNGLSSSAIRPSVKLIFFLFVDTPQEKVINIVPEDLLSPSTEAAPVIVNKDAQPDSVEKPRTIK